MPSHAFFLGIRILEAHYVSITPSFPKLLQYKFSAFKLSQWSSLVLLIEIADISGFLLSTEYDVYNLNISLEK